MTLTVGTLLLLGICYVLAAPIPQTETVPTTSAAEDDERRDAADRETAYLRVADRFRRASHDRWATLIRPPFVFAGDLSDDDLEALYRETVVPTIRALQFDYFDRDPDEPITVLILSSDEAYRSALDGIGHGRRAEYSGLYARDARTVVVNVATGAGTLAHELTHALAHADCPDLPEWLDEGLASLHEEADFSSDGLRLLGKDNWRSQFLHEAHRRDCWKPLRSLFERPFAAPQVAALDYALARYLCLFLQERGALAAYYRKCRGLIDRDPTGLLAFQRLFPGQSLDELDAEFRAWMQSKP